MKPTIVADYRPESFLVHWLVLEKECPIDVVTENRFRGAIQVKAPYYEDGDVLIYDLPTLVQFLQERYPGEQLLPADPVSRAQIRQACTLISEPDIDLITEIEAILDTGSEYMAGREFTLLDVYIGTWLREYVQANPVCSASALHNYWERISSRHAFRIVEDVH